MFSIRLLAAAALATSGLALASTAGAAPKFDAAAAPWSSEIVQVQHRPGDDEEWRRRDRDRDGRRGEIRDRDRNWDRDRESRRDRGHDRRGAWRWEDDRRYYRDNGRHNGWKQQSHWRVRYHPRHQYWVGRRLPIDRYVIIYNYDDYYLPPPRRGHYYARIDNDVFLVAAATRSIIDAFLLFDAVGR